MTTAKSLSPSGVGNRSISERFVEKCYTCSSLTRKRLTHKTGMNKRTKQAAKKHRKAIARAKAKKKASLAKAKKPVASKNA
jgi:hypothetical protein